MQPYTYRQQDADWNAESPHDTAPMPHVIQGGQAPESASFRQHAPAEPSPYDDYDEYFWGEGTEVQPRRRSGCAVVLGLLLIVATAAMIWPQSPVNYEVLRGTSLDQLQDWLADTFGWEAPQPTEEELEAIYGQETRADAGFLAADPPTGLGTIAAAQHYYRSTLDEHAATVYDALEAGLINEDERIAMPAGTSAQELQTCWQFVLYDHPEVFNLPDDAHVSYWTWGDTVAYLTPDYKYPSDEASTLSQGYEQLARELPLPGGTQEETMESICAYVADTTDYLNSDNDQYIDSVFTNRESVCAGYAKAVQYLALRHGIPCIYIVGTADDYLGTGGNHAWLAAFVDGEVRYYDPTWYDQRGWHATQFLGMNLVEISADHTPDYPQLLPR